MNLQHFEIFVAAAEGGSLAYASRKVGISAMAATRSLAALEAELGRRLLNRSNRAVTLTQEGHEFLPYARQILNSFEEGLASVNPQAKDASGLLRITSPASFARVEIIPLLPRLLDENPRLRVELDMSDQLINLRASGFDVAIRVADLKDSELVARPLADNTRILCASPEYIERYGAPVVLQDLDRHSCLTLRAGSRWRFKNGDETIWKPVNGVVMCNSNEGLRMAALQGLGLLMASARTVATDRAAGRLMQINLHDVEDDRVTIWAVCPSRSYTPVRVEAFLKLLRERLAQSDERSEDPLYGVQRA